MRLLGPCEELLLTEVLADAFPEVGWDDVRTRKALIDAPDVEAIYVVDCEGRPVATASVRYLPDRFPGDGVVHWVAVSSAHRGKLLGMAVVRRVCLHFIDDGYESAVLETDDHRLPAIKTYWKLGFRPHKAAPDHAERWARILDELGCGV